MEDNDKLTQAIRRLDNSVKRSNNLGWAILRGVFYSIGWAIGLALLATIIIYLMPKFSDSNAFGKFVHSVYSVISKNRQ